MILRACLVFLVSCGTSYQVGASDAADSSADAADDKPHQECEDTATEEHSRHFAELSSAPDAACPLPCGPEYDCMPDKICIASCCLEAP